MPYEEKGEKQHSVFVDGRNDIEVTGALDVESFGEDCICVITTMGTLTINGEKLHINKFSADEGVLSANGSVSKMEYTKTKTSEGGFFARLFK